MHLIWSILYEPQIVGRRPINSRSLWLRPKANQFREPQAPAAGQLIQGAEGQLIILFEDRVRFQGNQLGSLRELRILFLGRFSYK